jgi:hypothetical protein
VVSYDPSRPPLPLVPHILFVEASRTDARARDVLIEIRDLLVTKSILDFAETVDRLTSLCCLVLSESPPSAQVRLLGGGANSGQGNGDYNSGGTRRGSMMTGRSSMGQGGQHYNYGLQLDIERMFSRKIKVFDTESLQLTTECILSTILKVS